MASKFPDKELLGLYEKIVAELPEQMVKGSSSAYTSLNGHMFSFLIDGGHIALRLSREDQARFADRYGATQVIQHGAIMRDYVLIEKPFEIPFSELEEFFKASHSYIVSLKPKPTTRKK